MTHVLVYIGLSVLLILAVFIGSLIKLRNNKTSIKETFEIK